MIVTFCGHREVYQPDAVRAWLTDCVETLICKGATDFYLGGHGAFDSMAASVVWKLKEKYPGICSVLVIPYLNREIDTSRYDLTTYPPLENVPKRFAISRRNQWMCQTADVVVAYVRHIWGGAAATLEYAVKKKKRVILYDDDGCDGNPFHTTCPNGKRPTPGSLTGVGLGVSDVF